MFHVEQETTWDGDTTTWDRDWDGPGTRTRWDLIPAALGYAWICVLEAPARFAALAETVRKGLLK